MAKTEKAKQTATKKKEPLTVEQLTCWRLSGLSMSFVDIADKLLHDFFKIICLEWLAIGFLWMKQEL